MAHLTGGPLHYFHHLTGRQRTDAHIDELIDEVKRDPTCIFWG